MKEISLWKEKFKITHSLVAPDGLASIHGLAYCMQESAINHAEAAQAGYEDLIKANQAWVLTRQMIKLFEIPELNQKITIETWANSRTDTMAIRDFNILDRGRQIMGISRTSWMVLDLQARRPVRLSHRIQDNIPLIPGRLVQDLALEKIPVSEQEPEMDNTYLVVYSDLDMNHHVNNINYLKWVLDDFDYDYRMKFSISSIETNYLAEALYGDLLVKSTVPVKEHEYLTKIVNRNSLKPILAARTKWLPKA
jgi:acyl-ACP thioesterase